MPEIGCSILRLIVIVGSGGGFSKYLNAFIQAHKIDTIVLFGDCRPLHRKALDIARSLNIEIFVFEEGYIRPNHITLEQVGVNGNSLLPRTDEYYLNQNITKPHKVTPLGNTFWFTVFWAIVYYLAATLGYPFFHRYKHHRPLHIGEGLYWIRGTWRKWWFKWRERGMMDLLTQQLPQQYFLAPLQLPIDAQVQFHSDFDNIEQFITSMITSFAQHAPKNTLLVIKQHPLDRGYSDYAPLIRRLAKMQSVGNRVLYLHDQNLPLLLRNARGVVVINSTVGLSALYHHAPTKVCGEAVYDIPQMCYQGSLDDFWRDAEHFKVNQELFNKYIHYLENRCQVNGSFYKKIKHTDNHTGLNLIHEKTVEWVKTLGVHAIGFSCGFLLNDLLSLPIGLV